MKFQKLGNNKLGYITIFLLLIGMIGVSSNNVAFGKSQAVTPAVTVSNQPIVDNTVN